MVLRYPMATGLNKGHKGTKNVSKLRHSHHCHRRLTQHIKFLLKVSKDKRALKFIKKQELSNVLEAVRKAAAKKD
ncbi:unnamed protein product [Nyctereutes procyonoides]|uniref:Large ribosomal subunit protein eL36 n=1 Tax=Nyctereutes procyonoides TaxID=34880 RepID=A0A811ZRM9_NYCPR|nr:unnamed protein product [Nyctereutes procyonoides]